MTGPLAWTRDGLLAVWGPHSLVTRFVSKGISPADRGEGDGGCSRRPGLRAGSPLRPPSHNAGKPQPKSDSLLPHLALMGNRGVTRSRHTPGRDGERERAGYLHPSLPCQPWLGVGWGSKQQAHQPCSQGTRATIRLLHSFLPAWRGLPSL